MTKTFTEKTYIDIANICIDNSVNAAAQELEDLAMITRALGDEEESVKIYEETAKEIRAIGTNT